MREVGDARERRGGARGHDAARPGFGKTRDQTQAEAQRRCGCGGIGGAGEVHRMATIAFALRRRLEGAVPVAHGDVDRPHLDAMPPRVVHELRGRVEAHRLAIEERRAERRRLVALEPADT